MPPTKRLGRPRETELRSVIDAILCIARTGCQWPTLPQDFPPFTTAQGYFYDWRDNGLFETINFHLLLQARDAAGREASPSAGVIDSQSVKTTESGDPRGTIRGHAYIYLVRGSSNVLSVSSKLPGRSRPPHQGA